MDIKEELIDAFIESIRMNQKDKQVFLNNSLSSETELEVYTQAVYLGYLDTCRTFKKKQAKINKDDNVVRDLAALIQSYLLGETDFNHSCYCNRLVNEYRMSFGQAQKIVNMTFKYLYCLTDSDDIRKRFDVCHMPLDSIMLEWLFRNVHYDGYPLVRKYMGAWSNMSESEDNDKKKYSYCYYQKILKKYCEDEEKCQLQLDFENWSKMAQELAVEEYLKAFSEKEKNCDIPMKTLMEHLN